MTLHEIRPVFGSILLAGVAALDATPVAQTLASQPLVTAVLVAALWGEWSAALQVGVVLQLLAASTMPVGARTPEDYATGGVVGASVAAALAHTAPYESLRAAACMVGVFSGMLAAMSGAGLVRAQRRWNEGLGPWVEAELAAGRERALGSAHAAAVLLAFAVAVAFAAAWMAVGLSAGRWLLTAYSVRLSHAWLVLQPLWIGFGLAQLLHAFLQRRLARAGAFALALMVTWLTIVVGMR